MLPEHPLRGQNDERFGPRFVNMSEPYSTELINKALELANQLKIDISKIPVGTYVVRLPEIVNQPSMKFIKN
jgi:purine nucleoside phosphorylase